MKIKLTTSLGGTERVLGPGDVHDCADAEAIRLIEAGHAVPHPAKAIERPTGKQGAEKR